MLNICTLCTELKSFVFLLHEHSFTFSIVIVQVTSIFNVISITHDE